MNVELFYEDTEILDLRPEFFVSWLDEVCQSHDKTLGDVSLIFTSDDYLLDMNRQHLEHDYYTDIITFNYVEEDISGDLFISVDRVRDNAKSVGVMFHVELYRVVVHGVLHLIGFNDKSDEEQEEMTRQENRALDLIVPRET